MSAKQKAVFFHTINGHLAHFNGRQLVYGARRIRPAGSLQQVRAERKATTAFRRTLGPVAAGLHHEYGCIRLVVPA